MPPPVPTTEDTKNLPPVCEIRDWPVFVDGYHKGQLFPDEDMDRMADNFRRLSGDSPEFKAEDGGPYMVATVKLGHDRQQRSKRSLGWLTLGRVTRLERGGPNGSARLWLKDVPTEVGGKVNAGMIRSGSIEVIPALPNPNRPAEEIRGPVMTGVSLLGEEQPAVKGMGRPIAVFADGTPVPPDYSVHDWLDAIVPAANEPDEEPEAVMVGGHSYTPVRLLFAEQAEPQRVTPKPEDRLTPRQTAGGSHADERQTILAKLKSQGVPVDDPEIAIFPIERLRAMDPEAEKKKAEFAANFAAACKSYAEGKTDEADKKCSGFSAKMKKFADEMGTAPAATPPTPAPTPSPTAGGAMAEKMKKFADDPSSTPEQQMMAAMYAEMEDTKRKLSALEAVESDKQKKSADQQMAAFSAQAEAVFAEDACKGRIPPTKKSDVVKLFAPTLQTFADGTAKPADAIADLRKYVSGFPVNDAFLNVLDDGGGKDRGKLTSGQVDVLNTETMLRYGPPGIKKILEEAGVK